MPAMIARALGIGLIVDVEGRRAGRLDLQHRAAHMRWSAEAGPGVDDERQVDGPDDARGLVHGLGQGDQRLPLGVAEAKRIAAEIERLIALAPDEPRREGVTYAGRGHEAPRHQRPQGLRALPRRQVAASEPVAKRRSKRPV